MISDTFPRLLNHKVALLLPIPSYLHALFVQKGEKTRFQSKSNVIDLRVSNL